MTTNSAVQLWQSQNEAKKITMSAFPKRLVLPTPVENYYSRVVNTINDLHQRGFISDFVLLDNYLFCAQTMQFFDDDEFDILEVYSFENDHSGREQTVVYAVEVTSNAKRGVLFQNDEGRGKQGVILRKLRKFWR